MSIVGMTYAGQQLFDERLIIRNEQDEDTPLHEAASTGSRDVAQYLVEKAGADIEATNKVRFAGSGGSPSRIKERTPVRLDALARGVPLAPTIACRLFDFSGSKYPGCNDCRLHHVWYLHSCEQQAA